MSLIIFIFVIGILVLVHETGHFVAAIILKIKVEEFAIGFGPALLKHTYKGINFRLNAFPLGGYVKIYGQEEDKKSKESYSERPVWQRLIVIVAGVFMNFMFASLLFFILLTRNGFVDKLDYSILDTENQLPSLGTINVSHSEFPMYSFPANKDEIEFYSGLSWEEVESFPAYIAGMPSFGMITHVDGEKVKNTADFSSKIKNRRNDSVLITVIDATEEKNDYEVVVRDDGLVGIYWLATEQVEISYTTLVGKATSGIAHSINYLQYQIRILSRVINIAIESDRLNILQDVFSGPVAVYQTVDVVSKGSTWLSDIILLSAFISLNLAFINILPFPVLDGGYVVLLLVELFTRKKLSKKYEQIILTVGMIVLILFSLVIFVNDIVRYTKRTEMFEINNDL